MAVSIRLGLTVSFLGVIFLAAISWWQFNAAEYFARALNAAHVVETVTIKGDHYVVRSGSVYVGSSLVSGYERLPALRLAYEKAVARRSPLIALEGTDPAKLRASVTRLNGAMLALATQNATSSIESSAVLSLFPTEFLKDAADLEESRQAFLASGSDTDAELYENALTRAFASYQENLRSFSIAFQRSVPIDASAYATESAVITRARTLQIIASLNTGSMEQLRRDQHRRLCFAGITYQCDPRDLDLAHIQTADPATKDQTNVSSRARRVLIDAGIVPSNSQEPLIALSSSTCVMSDIAPYFLYNEGSEALQRMFFIGDYRFVTTADHAMVPIYAKLAKAGIMYAPSQPLSYYECPAVGTDWARVVTTDRVHTLAERDPLSAHTPNADEAALKTIESKLASQRVIKESDAMNYVTIGQQLARSGVLAVPEANEVTSFSLMFADHSAGLDSLVDAVAAAESENASRVGPGSTRDNAPATLFLTRSAFLAFFLADNPSAVGNDILSFTPNAVPRAEQPFVWLSKLPDDARLNNEISSNIRYFSSLP